MFFLESAKTSHLLSETREFYPALKVLLLISGIIAFLSLIPTIFMLQLYERIITSRSGSTLMALCVIGVFLVGIWTVLEDMRTTILRRIAFGLDEKIAPRILETLNRFPEALPPNQISLVPQDLNTLREFIGGPLMVSALDFIFVPIVILAGFLLHPLMGLTILVLVIISAALSALSQATTKDDTARTVMAMNKAYDFGRSVQSNAEPLRVMGMLGRMVRRWRESTVEGLGWAQHAADRVRVYTGPLRFLRHLVQMVLQTVAVVLLLNEMAGPGLVFASGILAYRAFGPVDALANGWRVIWNLKLSVERIDHLLRTERAQVAKVALPRPNGPLVLNRVTVVPKGREAPTLQDVSFVAAPGTVVGVVGPSGAGKSTLARVLVGAWRPARGSILLDGHDLAHWDQDQLGAYIGYVPQDIDLMPGTLAENITRFQPVTDENSAQLIKAVKMSGIMDIVSKLPDGLSTRMGPEGRILSGGQRQRVALARALYGDPRLVVLDEPNSSIDSSGEQLLASAIAALRAEGAIVVLITHRMNMLSMCDQVLVLNSGTVHAFGERDQVLDRITAYKPKQLTDGRAAGERSTAT
ncbi:MAG: type I secretion system permease/ATPase [Proteobacteria bacterium]|nr:type I secretion system permease/ATPase [Pseudomonadota bacterium]